MIVRVDNRAVRFCELRVGVGATDIEIFDDDVGRVVRRGGGTADIYSGSDFSGRGGWTWYTGAAAWTWRLGVEAILGLYREAGGYRFDPCIPPEWRHFDATLRVGQSEIYVEVTNPDSIGRGVIGLSVDGKDLDPRRVVELDPKRSGRHHVRVVLGNDGSQPSRNRERRANPIDDRPVGPGETG